MIYLANAFSITMLRYPLIGELHPVTIERIAAFEAGRILRENDFRSVYGHGSTAWHLARYLHVNVPVRREAIMLTEQDTMIVARACTDRKYRSGIRKAPKWSFYRVTVNPRDEA